MNIGLILVAAGYGSLRTDRDGKPLSKLLEKVEGIPLFLHSFEAAEKAGLQQIVVVVSPLYGADIRAATMAARRDGLIHADPVFVVQEDRYGSGDAVMRAIPAAQSLGMKYALVVYADMPRWSRETMSRLAFESSMRGSVLTMLTVERHKSYPTLDRYGRIIRDQAGSISRVVEVDTATAEELASAEVNPSLWVWELSWLHKRIPHVRPVARPDGRCREVYLPPVVEIAYRERKRIGELRLHVERTHEALGVDTLQDLEMIGQRTSG